MKSIGTKKNLNGGIGKTKNDPVEYIFHKLKNHIMAIQIESKRIYEPYTPSDGFRILADRLWPRGISKEKAHIDLWFKEITPSTELRKWYNHEEAKFEEFKKRYVAELNENKSLIESFLKELKAKKITLLFAGKESPINHVVVLSDFMNKIIKRLKL